MEYSITHEKVYNLTYAAYAPKVWDALRDLKRTGWVKRGVEHPESVQEHTLSLRAIALAMGGLSLQEKKEIVDMLEVHDWPESLHGDEVILGDEQNAAELKAQKFENERKALATICEPLGEVGERIISLWMRFETSDDALAILAREIDKYQAVEKAYEYERIQGVPLFKEFLDYSRKYITHKMLVKKLETLEREWNNGVLL